MDVTFLGATGTVTGSRFLVEAAGQRVLIDAGLYQGLKELRQRNWADFPVPPAGIDAVVLTHAHIDHIGYLPRLVAKGLRCPVWATHASCDLAPILLKDAAHLQEEEARFANQHGYSKHAPALPLYTSADAEAACGLLRPHGYRQWAQLLPGIEVFFRRAGHILGSAHVLLRAEGRCVAFSGDVGRAVAPIMPPPADLPQVDLLVLESTYGQRQHPPLDPKAELGRVVRESAQRGGALIIPAFALGRSQELLYVLRELEEEGAIPRLPLFLDSPMAQKVTHLYLQHTEDLDEEMLAALRQSDDPLATSATSYVRDRQQSKGLNDRRGPFILISASGMLTGGRVLHHLARRLPDPATTVLIVGFQAAGTRGRALLDGARSLKMFGTQVAVRAHVELIQGFSAHADQAELTGWVGRVGDGRPARLALVHGEPEALAGLAEHLRGQGHRDVRVPAFGERIAVG